MVYTRFMVVTVSIALKLIPVSLKPQPVFLCIDDTLISKFGTKLEDVSKLFDHAAHNGSSYINGYCFVSILLCVPVWNGNECLYLSLPLGYRVWKKEEISKLELATSMVRQVMPSLSAIRNVILLCDSWYAKKNLLCVVDECENLDVICNARNDSVLYDLAPPKTGKRERPAKHGKRLSIEDFSLSDEKLGIITPVYAVSFLTCFGNVKCLPLSPPQNIQGIPDVFFSATFFRNSSCYSAHGRKKHHETRPKVTGRNIFRCFYMDSAGTLR